MANRVFISDGAVGASSIELTGTGKIVRQSQGGAPSLTALTSIPTWIKVGTDLTANSFFSSGGFTVSPILFALPAGGIIHGIKMKTSVAFANGGTFVTYFASIGVSGDLERYAPSFDMLQAVGPTIFQITSGLRGENTAGPVNILATATATGAILSSATVGKLDVWALLSKTP